MTFKVYDASMVMAGTTKTKEVKNVGTSNHQLFQCIGQQNSFTTQIVDRYFTKQIVFSVE